MNGIIRGLTGPLRIIFSAVQGCCSRWMCAYICSFGYSNHEETTTSAQHARTYGVSPSIRNKCTYFCTSGLPSRRHETRLSAINIDTDYPDLETSISLVSKAPRIAATGHKRGYKPVLSTVRQLSYCLLAAQQRADRIITRKVLHTAREI